MGRQVNQGELAEVLGVTTETIRLWQQEATPLPLVRRGEIGEENLYDTATVIAWLVARAENKLRGGEAPKDRLARLQADRVELELAKDRGELVPAGEVAPLWRSRVLAAAAFMAGRHSRLAAVLEATSGIEEKRQLLKEEDAAFLTKLGVDGPRMQAEVDALLDRLSSDEARAFLRRIAGEHDEPGPAGPGGNELGSAGTPKEDPAV